MAGFDSIPTGRFDDAYMAALPKLAPQAIQSGPTYGDNPLIAGLASGTLGLGGSLAGFGGAVGRATGITPLAEGGEDWARRLGAASEAAGLPQYEFGGGPDHSGSPWSVPGMGYQVAKAVPTLAAFMAGGAALAPAKAPAALAALGRVVPRLLGGAGGAVGEVAEAAGSEWARHLIGGGLAGYPLMAGGAYQEQLANGGPDQGKAALALGVGVPEAAIGAVMPTQLRGLAEKGLAGGITKRVLTGGAAAGATNMLQAGVQTALNQPFADPTTPFADRAKEIVKSALLGGAIGGLFGGAGGALGGNKPHGMDTPVPPEQPVQGPPAQAPEVPAEGPPGFQQRRWDDATIGNQEAPLPPTPTPLDPGLPFQQRRMGEAEVLPGAPVYTPPEPPRQLTYQPPGAERGFVSPQGDVWPSLGIYDQRNQAPVGYQNELFGRPLQEPLPPAGVPQDRPGYVGPQAPGFDTAGEAPAPLPVQANPEVVKGQLREVLKGANVKPTQVVGNIAKEAVVLMQADPTLSHDQAWVEAVRNRIQSGGAKGYNPVVEALALKSGIIDKSGQVIEQPREAKNAAEVRGPETVATAAEVRGPETMATGEQARPVDGVREGNTVGDEIPRPGPEEIPTQAPVEGAAETPAPVQEATAPTAPTAGPVEPKTIRSRIEDAYLALTGGKKDESVSLAKLRAALPDVDRPTMDAALGGILKGDEEGRGAASLMRNDDPRQLKQADHKAAYSPAGEPFHTLWLSSRVPAEVPAPTTGPVERPKGTLGLKEGKVAAVGTPEAPKSPEAPKPPEPTADEKALAAKQAENARIQALAQTGLSARAQELAQMRAERPIEPPVDKTSAIYKTANNIKEPGKPAEKPVAPAAAVPKGRPSLEEIRAKVAAKTAVTEQGVFDLAGQGGDATAALAHIAEHGPSSTSRELAKELQDRVKAAGVQLPMTTGIDGAIPEGWSAASSWNKQTGVITLGRQDHAHEDLMHEVVHPLIYKAAEKNTQGWRTLKGVFLGLAKGVGDETLNDPTLKYAFNAPLPEGSDPAKALHLRTQEFASEVWSNPNLQAYLKETAPNTWGKIQNAFFRMAGASDKVRSAFDDVMDVSRRVMDEAKALPLTDGRPPIPGHEPTVGSIPHANATLNKLFPIVDKMREDLKSVPMSFFEKLGPGLKETMAQARAYATEMQHIGWELKNYGLGQGEVHDQFNRDRRMIASNMAQVGASAIKDITALPAKAQEQINKLMRWSAWDVDPAKTWAEHTWLQKEPNAADLQKLVLEANKDYRDAGSMKALDVYEAARTTLRATRYAELASQLHHFMQGASPESMKGVVNPSREFQYADAIHGSPAETEKFWQGRLKGLTDLADKLVLDKPGSQEGLVSQLALVGKGIDQVEKGAAYFPVTHGNGDYFAGGRIATVDGRPNPVSVAAIADALKEARFDGLTVQKDLASDRIFLRVDTAAQQQQAAAIFLKLEKQGHFAKEDGGESTIKSGKIDDPVAMAGVGPKFLAREIAALQERLPEPPEDADDVTKAAYAKAHTQALGALTRQWMGVLSDNSLAKSLQKRDSVHAFDENMLKAFNQRVLRGAGAVADYGTRADIAANLQSLRSGVKALKSDPEAMTNGNATAAQRFADEIITREAQKAWTQSNPYFDTALAAVSTAHIGSSPGVGLMMLSQIPMFTVPQFVKNFPYRVVVPTLAKTFDEAMKVTRAVIGGEYGESGGFSHDELVKAVGADKALFHMRNANHGDYTGGTFTHMMTSAAEGGDPRTAKMVGWANAIGRYTELIPRIWTGAAARELYSSLPKDQQMKLAPSVEDFVSRSILQSQKDYSSSATSRLTGKSGPFGQATPLMLSFTAFQTRVLTQYYRELNGLFGKVGATPEERKANQIESGRFLLAHAASTMMLAGTLGLPAAGFLSGAYDKIASALTGRDDINVEASYRHWLDSVFGPQVGAAVARGLPRFAGIDLSELGFQHVIPFTRMMQEKRKFEDAEHDWLRSMAGAAFGDVTNAALGARDMMNGDYMLGLQKILPETLRDMVGAYRAEKYGYINKDGTPLPIQPAHWENLLQAVGIEPARKADYDEAVKAEQGLTAQRSYRSGNIDRHLMLAQSTGERGDQAYWMQQARQYAQNNPGMVGPLQGFPMQLTRQVQQAAQARGLGMPLGIRANDLATRRLTDFGNWR